MSTKTDIDLWIAFSEGDEQAFNSLFRMHYNLLFQFGSKLCSDTIIVEDAIQELFIELWQKKSPPPSISVRAYLLKAVKYKIFKHFRNKKTVNLETYSGNEPFEISYDHFIVGREEDREKTKIIIQALEKLPVRQKEIIYLKLYKGLDYEEISEIMNLNYQVVRNLLCQALKTFRKLCGQ